MRRTVLTLCVMLLTRFAAAGFVFVDSDPKGAKICTVRDEKTAWIGSKTPSMIRAKEGPLTLVLRLEGYEDEKVEIDVRPGITKPGRVALEPKKARIDVIAEALTGWAVLIDGKPTHKTAPCSVDAKPGKRLLSFVKKGYQDLTVRITVSLSSEAMHVDVERKPLRGRSRLLPLLERSRAIGRWTKADSGTTFEFRKDGTLTKTTLDGRGLKTGRWESTRDGRVRLAIRGLCSAVLRFDPSGDLVNEDGWRLTRKE